MDTIQSRLRHWREEIRGLSLRDLRAAVNAHLPEPERVSLGTVSNYERPPGADGAGAGPRAGYLAALKRAFPELRLRWLLLGEGRPTELAERVGGRGDLEGGRLEEDPLAARILARHPDLELLSPEASALFTGALTRYATGVPELDLTEDQLLELAADLRWLLFAPLRLWGFRHAPDYERFAVYSVAALHALMLAMPGSGDGEPGVRYGDYPNRRLRASLSVGFGEPPAAGSGQTRAAGSGERSR